jgi:hypothetical protein
MSVLGLMESTADTAQTTPDLSALPSTNSERFSAAWGAAQTDDRYWNVQTARKTRADKIIDDLHAMTGERLKNPYDNAPTSDEIRENLGQPTTVIYAKRLEKLRTATRNAKAGIEQLGGLPQDYLDVDSIDADIASQSGAARARDERMSGTGGGLGGFLGSMAGETVSPHGIMSSFIPVTRMGSAVAEAGVAAFAKNVAREAIFQGGTQGAAQSLATIVDYNTRKQFGTEQTNEQILEEIISAAAGGALLGGAFRAAHLGILKLASRGVEIPPAALDSARVMEEADLYGNKNPLRISPAQMEVATDQATSAAALGRAASPNVDVSGVPTLHDAARRLEPELMARYDQAVAWRDEARATLAPDDATIARLKERADAADAAIANAGGATQEVAERLGASARMAHLVHDDAVARKAAMEAGQPLEETTVSQSMRQQAAQADLELRELIPEINKVMMRAGEEVTAATRAAEAARAQADTFLSDAAAADTFARVESKLSPEDVSRVRELQEQIPEYERMRDEAAPEDRAAWQQAIDDFNGELAKIMDLDVADQAPVKAAMAKLEAVPDNPMQAPRPAPPEPEARPAAAKAPGESPEDKAVLQQAKALLDSETIAKVDPEARAKMEDLDIKEREYQTAVSCVVGAVM